MTSIASLAKKMPFARMAYISKDKLVSEGFGLRFLTGVW
jgi:hypothetical protein